MKTVLLPFDGSDSAGRALDHLLRMSAAQRPDTIHVLNVQGFPVFHGQILTHEFVQLMREQQMSHGRDQLKAAEQKLLAAGVSFQSHVVIGQTAETIVEMASQLGCDQIVMGTRGMGTMKTLWLGSVAYKTVHMAEVPVTLVK